MHAVRKATAGTELFVYKIKQEEQIGYSTKEKVVKTEHGLLHEKNSDGT